MRYLFLYAKAFVTGVYWYFKTIGRVWTVGPNGQKLRFGHSQAMVVAATDWDMVDYEKQRNA